MLRTVEGSEVGCVVGHIIRPSAAIFKANELVLEVRSDDRPKGIESAIQEFLRESSGRFLCLVTYEDVQRIYLDAAASLSCVYGTSVEVVASTPGLILDRNAYYKAIDVNLAATINISNDGWYPAGLTPHPTIRRLLPNHYLDMVRWRATRHWPEGEIPVAESVENNVARIADTIKANIQAVTRERKVYLPITAAARLRNCSHVQDPW